MNFQQTDSPAAKPDYVQRMEAVYGAPSQRGFGSAVIYQTLQPSENLEQAALAKYRYFVGSLWERFGEEAWMSAWKQVYTRPAGAKPDIVAELRSIADPDASQSVPMILDVIESPEKALAALAAAYDDPSVVDLAVYALGDGAAMSGLLIVGRRSDGGTTYLTFLYD